MPTGYTADVQSGKITEFPDFALICARAFGALVTMRDDPLDAPLPKTIKAETSYHDKALKDATERLAKLRAMTPLKAAREADKSHQKAADAHAAYLAEKREQKARYEAMLAKAKEWVAPSPDHFGLKKFMIEQLSESIKFDCDTSMAAPAASTGAEWLANEIARAERDIAYHQQHREEEIERAKGRTEWLAQLRKSIA